MGPMINPFTLPESQKGWRGLEVTGRPRRKVFTVLENEHVLVTALMQIPGEPGVRHMHESGELSFRYAGDMTPFITWNRPGEWHGGSAEITTNPEQEVAEALALMRSQLATSSPEVKALFTIAEQLQDQVSKLKDQSRSAHGPPGGPGLIIDLIFPPFKTVIEDESYPERREIVGQWYD